MKNEVIVTGAHGFVGRHIARAASARGYRVRGIGHGAWASGELDAWGIHEWISADISVDGLLRFDVHPDYIFHCAGSGSVAYSVTNPSQDFERTVISTLAVLEYTRLHCRSAQIIFPSSAGVYGRAEYQPISVNSELKPTSPYGVHKRIAEELIQSYGNHFGISSLIVRLFSVYGIGLRKQLLWDACQKLSKGETTFTGSGNETRDWIHVEDAASLMLNLAHFASPYSKLFNGGSGFSVKVKTIVEYIASFFPNNDPVRFTGELRAGDPIHYQADVSELKEVNWNSTKDLNEEIANYVSWFKSLAD